MSVPQDPNQPTPAKTRERSATSASLGRALRTATLLCLACAAVGLTAGCDDDEHSHDGPGYDIGFATGGVVAGEFQSLDDYFAHPTVRFLIENMPIHRGVTPPDVAGTYDAFGGIADTTIPGSSTGDPVTAAFCFGIRAGSILEVRVLDPTVEDAGATSFIEGSGDRFTVYTAFRSVQVLPDGSTCEIHEVNLFSARREADGSLTDLHLGLAVVGLIGRCDPLLVGDAQVSRLAALLVGPACSAPAGPGDPANVELVVENLLLNPVRLFDDPAPDALALLEVAPLGFDAAELAPGFQIDFESVPPLAGQDGMGNDLFSGEIIAGLFPPDDTPAGGSITYIIESLVGDEEYFAPRPFNFTREDIYSVVNVGVNVPGFPQRPGGGLDCYCILPPSGPADGPYDVGYYSYSVPGVVTPLQANVHFFRVSNDTEIVPPFIGPTLPAPDIGSGAVLLEVRN